MKNTHLSAYRLRLMVPTCSHLIPTTLTARFRFLRTPMFAELSPHRGQNDAKLHGGDMALVTCTECSKEISDKAASCIHCGAPRSQAVTIEQTGKSLKAQQIIAAALFIFGLI